MKGLLALREVWRKCGLSVSSIKAMEALRNRGCFEIGRRRDMDLNISYSKGRQGNRLNSTLVIPWRLFFEIGGSLRIVYQARNYNEV